MNRPIDIQKYQHYLQDYVDQAFQHSDGTPDGIRDYLEGIQIKGLFVRNRDEKLRARFDLLQAFSEHRHWPLEIILSHLGLSRTAQ